MQQSTITITPHKNQQLLQSTLIQSQCYIHISINNIEIRHSQNFNNIYFSFIHKQKLHFSSAINSKTSHINDDIFIKFDHQDEIPDTIKLQRWENHMILLEHQLDITELKGRNVTKKKLETKQNEIISLTFTLLNMEDFKFLDLPVGQILQHYLILSKLQVLDRNKTLQTPQLTYMEVQTKEEKYILPIINSQVVIQLPAQLRISYYKNNQLFGRSDWFESKQFNSKSLQLGLYDQKGSYCSKVRLNLQWGTNLLFKKLQSSILYQAHELCVYDIQVKFDNFSQFSGAKLKFVYGSKAFDILGQFNHRIVQFQRIIYIILKSQDEEVSVYCQRNNKIVAEAKFNTSQMLSHKVIAVKKYFSDPVSHRPLGYVKFLCQKAKNLSLPASNTFWKQFNKKKHPSKLMLRIQQLSVESQSTKNLQAILKTQKEQYKISPLPNFTVFQPDSFLHEPLLLTIQQKLSIYMLIKQKYEENTSSENDFLGISAINYEELRLGLNPLKLQFYKNQQMTVEANCIINKIVPYPFIKGNFQQEISRSSHTKTFTLSVEISKIEFEPYFYTFEYEKKSQVYCIFEVGKTKKVVVLEPSKSNGLLFEVTKSSDQLNFVVSESDFVKAKLIFLASSMGKDEQVYGWSIVKLKMADFLENQIQKFEANQIKNEHGIFIGFVSLQIKKSTGSSSQILSNRQIKKIKNQMIKVNENMEKIQRNISKNKHIVTESGIKTPILERILQQRQKRDLPIRYINRRQYSPQRIRLPKI